jgi:hypothetical protein
MRDMIATIDRCGLAVSPEACTKIRSWAKSLSSYKKGDMVIAGNMVGSIRDGGIVLPGEMLGVFLFISYDEPSDEIRIYQSINKFGGGSDLEEYAKINFRFSRVDILDFSFKNKESLYIKDDDHFYIDRTGLFGFINAFLGFEAFKFKTI